MSETPPWWEWSGDPEAADRSTRGSNLALAESYAQQAERYQAQAQCASSAIAKAHYHAQAIAFERMARALLKQGETCSDE